MNSPRIGAIVVTYNRWACLQECLAGIKEQTFPVSEIFVIDNASEDGTVEGLGRLFPGLCHVRLPKNVGSSGGFFEGMKRAYAEGFEWLWVMDDDCLPSADSLERLCEAAQAGSHAIYGPRNIDANTRRDVWYRWPDAEAKSLMPVRSVAFNGLFLPREVVAAVGLPFRDLRICADDVEYCQRARTKGYRTIIVRDAVVYHPEPAFLRWGRVRGQPLLTCPKYRSPDRAYYHVRNWTYVLLRHWRTFGKLASIAQVRIMACLVLFGQISPGLAFRATVDGVRLLFVNKDAA